MYKKIDSIMELFSASSILCGEKEEMRYKIQLHDIASSLVSGGESIDSVIKQLENIEQEIRGKIECRED